MHFRAFNLGVEASKLTYGGGWMQQQGLWLKEYTWRVVITVGGYEDLNKMYILQNFCKRHECLNENDCKIKFNYS